MSKYKEVYLPHFNTEDTETGYFRVSDGSTARSYRYYVFKHNSELYMIEHIGSNMHLCKYNKDVGEWYDFVKKEENGEWVAEVVGGELMLPTFRQILSDHFLQKFSKLGSLL